MNEKKEKRRRVQVDFTKDGFEEIKALQDIMEVSRPDLIMYALRWLQWTLEETGDGGRIFVKKPNQKMKEVVAPFLRPARARKPLNTATQ